MKERSKRCRGAILVALVAVLIAPVLTPSRAQGAGTKGVVNINTASAEQLAYLPRVGPSVAGRIIDFREKNGKFEDPTDLLLVRGIGDSTFELIEPYVTISGETSLSEKVRVERKSKGGSDGWDGAWRE